MQLFSKKLQRLKLRVWVIIVRNLEGGWTQVSWCQDMADLYAMCIFNPKNSPFELMETFTEFPLNKQV